MATTKAASAVPPLTQEQLNNKDAMLRERIARALRGANRSYEISRRGPSFFHLKSGHTWLNVLFGCCGQCYKFDVDFRTPDMILIRSAVDCNGWWGGMIGAGMEQNERGTIQRLFLQEFPGYQVIMSG